MEKIKNSIHSDGWVYVIILAILAIIFFPFFPFIGIFLTFLTLFVLNFFRDPKRIIPSQEFILSPADGLVTFIGESFAPPESKFKKKFIKISIFLNIFDVHINRIPTNGMVKKIIYVPGKFINASLDKSSQYNERNITIIENNNSETFIVCQIAGLIARRIVCDIKKNQNLLQGDKLGIIKFGSRVDLYIPLKYKILIATGQRVIGGETIISNPNNISEITQTKII